MISSHQEYRELKDKSIIYVKLRILLKSEDEAFKSLNFKGVIVTEQSTEPCVGLVRQFPTLFNVWKITYLFKL